MGTDHHNVEFWFSSCLFCPKGVHTFALNNFFMSNKLEANKRERKKKVNACVAFHQMAEHGRNELQQLGSKKGEKQKQVVYAQQYYTDCR